MPLYTGHPEYSSQILTVTNTSELNAAIIQMSTGSGGTILVDGSMGAYQIDAHGLGSNGAPVLIKPLDSTQPPQIEQVDIYDSSFLTVTGMDIDSAAIADIRHVSITDVNIYGSNDIQIVGNAMDSSADAKWTPSNPPAETAITISGSQNIDILNNVITDYKNAIIYFETVGMKISGNDISGLQGDALKGGGIQDVVISNNYIHDFYGSTQDINHSDMIQIFGTGRTLVTQNVDIYGNTFDNGDGAGTQGIFIRNETVSQNGQYQNISIHDNVIYSAMPEGIGAHDINGLSIYDNTVLWSQSATYLRTETDTALTMPPRIMAFNSTNTFIDGNLVGDSSVDGVKLAGNNYIVDYYDPSSAAYIGNHVVNFSGTGQDNLTDLQLVTSSPVYGVFGSPVSSGGSVVTPTTGPVVPPVTTPGGGTDTDGAEDTTTNGSSDTGGAEDTTTGGSSDTDGAEGGNFISAFSDTFFDAISSFIGAATNIGSENGNGNAQVAGNNNDPGTAADDAQVILLSDLVTTTGTYDETSIYDQDEDAAENQPLDLMFG